MRSTVSASVGRSIQVTGAHLEPHRGNLSSCFSIYPGTGNEDGTVDVRLQAGSAQNWPFDSEP
jgi:hypothetical protein